MATSVKSCPEVGRVLVAVFKIKEYNQIRQVELTSVGEFKCVVYPKRNVWVTIMHQVQHMWGFMIVRKIHAKINNIWKISCNETVHCNIHELK